MENDERLSWRIQHESHPPQHDHQIMTGKFICTVIFPFVLTHRSHGDVAFEYLYVAFIAQELSKVSELVEIKEMIVDSHSMNVEIKVKGILPAMGVERKIKWLQCLFDYDEYDENNSFEHSDCGESVTDAFEAFKESIENQGITAIAPEYCDQYLANWLADGDIWNEESAKRAKAKNPEWGFHAWRSCWSDVLGFEFIVSPHFWIMASDVDLSRAWPCSVDYRPKSGNKFLTPKHVFSNMDYVFLDTGKEMIRLSLDMHLDAYDCAMLAFPPEYGADNLFNEYSWTGFRFFISEDMFFIVCEAAGFRYLIFRESFSILPPRDVDDVIRTTRSILADSLKKGTESVRNICDWDLIDDDSFEFLCYDLINRDGRFSPERTRKMGCGRSRDGGRDVMAWLRKRAGGLDDGKPWIVQCKYSASKKSLGRHDQWISELIDEYAPAGIIIATNMLIDAGTYDKVDRIGKNRAVPIECWDGLSLEWRLNRNPDIYCRYWNQSL